MLLWLTDYLTQYYSGFAVFRYLTLRAIMGVLTALGMSLLLGPVVIRRLNALQIGQAVREVGVCAALPSCSSGDLDGLRGALGERVSG